MRNRWLLCVFLSALSWGQAAPATPPPAQPAQTPAPTAPNPAAGQQQRRGVVVPTTPAATSDASAIPPTAAVLTVKGVCPAQPKATAAKGTAAKPASAAKTPPADCKTVVTKKEFELLLKGLPNANPAQLPQLRRNVANVLPRLIAMSSQAERQGMDRTPEFREQLKVHRMQILATELQQKIQEDALEVSDQEIANYYEDHHDTYEQFSLERLFVPRSKQVQPEAKEEEEKQEGKLTDEQQKAKQAEEKAKQEENMEAMTKLAESLRSRAAAGEDFAALQKEAIDAAGMKIASPVVSMPNQRRSSLGPAQASVFDLKPGDVSQVISDAGGHYIYKVKSKEQLSLDQVKDEIRRNLQSQHSREAIEKINNSFTVEKNEAYFGPEGPGVGFPQRPPMPRPGPPPSAPTPQPQAAPAPQQQTAPPAQPAQPPAAKPN